MLRWSAVYRGIVTEVGGREYRVLSKMQRKDSTQRRKGAKTQRRRNLAADEVFLIPTAYIFMVIRRLGVHADDAKADGVFLCRR